jgi:hypothetical protein
MYQLPHLLLKPPKNSMRKLSIEISLTKKTLYIILSSIGILVSSVSQILFAGTLSCTVATSCPTGAVIYRMSSTSNAHAELASQSLYPQLVCCSGISGVGNSCSGTYAVALRLQQTTNSHSEENSFSDYAQLACLQAPSGGTVSIAYQNSNCTGYDTTLGSMYANTNSHVGDANAFSIKICATMTQPTLTFAVDSGTQNVTVTPGSVAATSSILTMKTTNPSGYTVAINKVNAGNTMTLNTDATVVIADKTAWIAPIATTTAGNATASTTQPQTLQFRVRTAGTDAQNLAPTWWGSNDLTSGALFAGFPSSAQLIVNSSIPAAATSTAYVLYNINVPTTQQSGVYSGNMVYTAVVNP